MIEQRRTLRYRVRSFVDKWKNETAGVKETLTFVDIFRRNYSDAAVILRDELKSRGAESALPKITFLHPQSRSDISDILDELEDMVRRL